VWDVGCGMWDDRRGMSAEAVVRLSDLRFTNYEVFGAVEEFVSGYVLGFPKLSGWELIFRTSRLPSVRCSTQEFKIKSFSGMFSGLRIES